MGSTFNPWYIDGADDLKADGEEPLEIVAGPGIAITSRNYTTGSGIGTGYSKQIFFSSTISQGIQGTFGNTGTSSWTPVLSSGITQDSTDGNLFTKTGGGTSSWDNGVSSEQGFVLGAFASCKVTNTSGRMFFGLNSDPLTDNNFSSIDYAIYLDAGTIRVYESGSFKSSHGTYTTSDIFYIIYDGSRVAYYKNDVRFKITDVTPGTKLHLDSSYYNTNLGAYLYFGPSSAQGVQGSQGISGSDGDDGAQGFRGYQGFTGLQGFYGVQGTDASAIAAQGTTGTQGRQGIQGTYGRQGLQGPGGGFAGATFPYGFSSSTAASNPGIQYLRVNNSSLSNATQIYINEQDRTGTNIDSFIATIDDSTSPGNKGFISLYQVSNPRNYVVYRVSGNSVNNGSYWNLSVSYVAGSVTSFSNNEQIAFTFGRSGDNGTQGAQGLRGYQGIQGLQGLQGITGAFASIGLQGYQGIQGDIGIQGSIGYQGIQGLQGVQGYNGLSTPGLYVYQWTPQTNPPSSGYVATTTTSNIRNTTEFRFHKAAFLNGAVTSYDISSVYDDIDLALANGREVYIAYMRRSTIYSTLTDTAVFEITGKGAGNIGSPIINYYRYTVSFMYGQGTASWGNYSNRANEFQFIVTGGDGPQGMQGIQGLDGAFASIGLQGYQGVQGSFGLQGLQGPQGPQGIQGIQGPQGILGSQGRTGSQGADSTVVGPQGTDGYLGQDGSQGIIGIQGIQGLDGAFAGQGVQGTTGGAGAAGGVSFALAVALAAAL